MQKLFPPLAALSWLIMQSGFALAAPAEPLTAALTAARADASIPLHLRVDCNEQDGRRSLEVIRGTVAIWGNERQVRLSEKDRGALIDLLLEADFAGFAPRYGETQKASKQEAPLRVSCRIHVAVEGLEKTSVQVLDGEQSEVLLGLARRLLDRVEPLAADGVTATNLEDGLAKLADGTLAYELLELRLLTLPNAGDAAPGTIMRIEGGQMSTQAYTPGKVIGQVHTERLALCHQQEVVAALRNARFWDLPVNLYADEVTELEVRILAQRKTVIARSSFDFAATEIQTAFANLLSRLNSKPPACRE